VDLKLKQSIEKKILENNFASSLFDQVEQWVLYQFSQKHFVEFSKTTEFSTFIINRRSQLQRLLINESHKLKKWLRPANKPDLFLWLECEDYRYNQMFNPDPEFFKKRGESIVERYFVSNLKIHVTSLQREKIIHSKNWNNRTFCEVQSQIFDYLAFHIMPKFLAETGWTSSEAPPENSGFMSPPNYLTKHHDRSANFSTKKLTELSAKKKPQKNGGILMKKERLWVDCLEIYKAYYDMFGKALTHSLNKTTKHVDHHVSVKFSEIPKFIFDILFWSRDDIFSERKHLIDLTNIYVLETSTVLAIKEFSSLCANTNKNGQFFYTLVPPIKINWTSNSHELSITIFYNVI